MTTYQTLTSPRYFVSFVAFIGALGGLLFGFDTGVIAGALLFINKSFPLTTGLKEIVVSSVVLGAFFSSLFSGKLADLWGRRTMLMFSALAFIIGTLLTIFATTTACLIVGRLIVGCAIGISSYTVPLFISEMAPQKHRGSLVLLNAITITGGQACAFLVCYYFATSGNWRMMFGIGLVPATLLLIGMLFSPSSPRWLVLKGFPDKAKVILEKIRSGNVDNELQGIKESFSLKPASWPSLFSKRLRPVLLVGVGLGILQQAVGINTVMYYGPTLFKAAGFQNASSQILATFGMGLVNAVMSLITLLIIDKVGRRKLLLIGASIAGISLFFVGYHFYIQTTTLWLRWLSVAGLVCYIAGYSISVGSLFWLIIAEIYPLNIRGQAMSFVTAVQWAANFVITMSFLTIIQAIGPAYTLWLYGTMCFICVGFCYVMVPETKNISLETIEKNLTAGKPARQLGQTILTHERHEEMKSC